MKNTTSSPATYALAALLATQAPQALGQEAQTLAEPFRIDVESILDGTDGQLTRVSNPTELADNYVPGSSVVVEGDFGLSDRILRDLQAEINEKYSHLNILVYLAEDGRSFEEYNGQRIQSSNLCGTNPGLAYLRDSFYEGVDNAGEGNHVIFYLAAKEPGYDYNMVCTLISPQLAELIGSDEDIFVKGRPIFDSVFQELAQDFNKLGAVKAFLRGIDERVQEAMRVQEQERLQHNLSVDTLSDRLISYRQRLETLNQDKVDISSSSLFVEFQEQASRISTLIAGEPEYVSRDDIEFAESLLQELDAIFINISNALTGFSVSRDRILELEVVFENFKDHEYFDRLSSEHTTFGLSLDDARQKLEAGDLDYYVAMQKLEGDYNNLQDGVQSIENINTLQKVGLGAAFAGFLTFLGYLNRRPRRLNAKKEFLQEISKLRAGLKETRRIFEQEIEGNTESIEMFFGDQRGETAITIDRLKESVAYISVILPKIEEILQSAEKAIGASSILGAKPYEEAIEILGEKRHIIDPSSGEVDKKLLEKINGGEEIVDLTTLIDSLTKTLPELIEILDEEIQKTKEIFVLLESSSEDLDRVVEEYGTLFARTEIEIQKLVDLLGPKFSSLEDISSSIISLLQTVGNSSEGQDILGEYAKLKKINAYIGYFLSIVLKLQKKIEEENPSKYREGLEQTGYDVSTFLADILTRYQYLFQNFGQGLLGKLETEPLKVLAASVEEFYESMNNLFESEQKRLKLESEVNDFEEESRRVESDMRQQLGDHLQSKKLFVEEGKNIGELISIVRSAIVGIGEAITVRDVLEADSHIRKGLQKLSEAKEILGDSQNIISNYDENVSKLQELGSYLQASIEKLSHLITELREKFANEILILKGEDDESDTNISNNVGEIEELLERVASCIRDANIVFGEGKFLQAQNILEDIYILLSKANEYKAQVEVVYKDTTNLDQKNSEKFGELQTRFDTFEQVAQSIHITPKTQKLIEELRSDITTQIPRLFTEAKPNPYEVDAILREFEERLGLAQGEASRDDREFEEYIEYCELAKQSHTNLKRSSENAQNDRNPDSRKVKKIFSSVGELERVLHNLLSHREVQVSDWYRATDALEVFIKKCESGIRAIQSESRERSRIDRDIEKSKNKIQQAKRWSGRYVSISSTVGESELRSAHRAFQNGDFSEAHRLANLALSIASRAIADADSEDARIKRRKQQEAAARRARQSLSSYSSSSSSSFGGSSFGGGGGFSGFSGGGGF